MRIVNYLSVFILGVLGLIIVTGGGIFNIAGSKIGLASADVWAILLGVIILAAKTKVQAYDYLVIILKKLNSKKAFLIIFGFFILSLLIGHLFKHWSINTDASDVAFVNQALHYPLECDICKNGHRFGEHLGVTLYLISPIVQMIQGEEVIIFLQIGFYALALFLLITKGPLADRPGLFAFAFLIFISHRALKGTLIWDFKEDHLGSIFLLLSFLGLYKKQFIFFAICIIGVLLSKEHTGFIVPLLAIPIWFEKDLELTNNQKFGLISFVVLSSITWMFLVFGYFLPIYQPTTGAGSGAHLTGRLGIPGANKKEILMNLFLSPSIWWMLLKTKVFTVGAIKYIAYLYIPFIYLLRKRWWWIAATISVLAMNLISTFSTMRMMIFHYENFILPTLIFGSLLAIRKDNLNLNQKIIALLLALCVSGKWPGFYMTTNIPIKTHITFLKNIPNDGKILATPKLLAQITNLEEIGVFTKNWNKKSDHLFAAKYLLMYESEKNLLAKNCLIKEINREDNIVLYEFISQSGHCLK